MSQGYEIKMKMLSYSVNRAIMGDTDDTTQTTESEFERIVADYNTKHKA